MVKTIKLATWVKGMEEAAIYHYYNFALAQGQYSVACVGFTRFYFDLESAETFLITNGYSKLR